MSEENYDRIETIRAELNYLTKEELEQIISQIVGRITTGDYKK